MKPLGTDEDGAVCEVPGAADIQTCSLFLIEPREVVAFNGHAWIIQFSSVPATVMSCG